MMPMIVPVQFPFLQRFLVDLLTNKVKTLKLYLFWTMIWWDMASMTSYIYHLWSGHQSQCDQNQVLLLLIKNEATYCWWMLLYCNFCTKHHNWFQTMTIACHLQWQHHILKSTKGCYKSFWIIIKVFEHILPTISANNLKINVIHWWSLVEFNFYPHAGQKCSCQQGWFLDGKCE